MAEWKCIGCDTPIPNGSDQCPMCGAKAKYQAGTSEAPASSPPAQKIITVERTTESAKKKCHKCAMMIPKEASICPHCRKPQGMTLATKLFLALIAVAILANILPHNKPNDTQSEKQTVTVQPPVPLTAEGKIIKNNHPAWDNADCNTIAMEKINIGMTKEQVEEAWGRPYKINYSTGAYGTHEQWVMHESGSTYVYFENGIMTSLQQSK